MLPKAENNNMATTRSIFILVGWLFVLLFYESVSYAEVETSFVFDDCEHVAHGIMRAVASRGLEIRSCVNAILLNPTTNRTTMTRYFNNNKPLLCYTVKHFFYIPPVLVVWRRITSQTREFASGETIKVFTNFCMKHL
jgi:hypothetical protein